MKRFFMYMFFIFSSILFIFNLYIDVSYGNDNDSVINRNDFEFVFDNDTNLDEKVEIEEEEKEEKEEKEYIGVTNNKIYKNKNYVGNLKISGTEFKEPIYKYSDNDYYLTHDGRGKKKSSGATYMDYRVDKNANKILIYGHNNNSLSLPFSILENYNDKDYFNNHKYLILDIDGEEYTYEIFSIYIETSNWDYMKIDFPSREYWYLHLKDLKSRSIYDTEVDISRDDDILILQTCSKNKDYAKYKNKYMLVIAKKLK